MANAATDGFFVWHDLMTSQQGPAVQFYSKVVGWDTEVWNGPEPYTMWKTAGGPIGGIMTLPPGAGAPPHWLGYISTSNVDDTTKAATGLGATVMVKPTDIPDVGRFAVLTDPQGAAFAVYASQNPSVPGPPKNGEFSWHELATSNPGEAISFYQSLFGWTKDSEMDMGEAGTYAMFGKGSGPFIGIYRQPPEMPGPPAWAHYIHVDDVNRVAEVVKANGGQVVNGPMEVPGGDMIANCIDPQGAMFSIHSKT